jgi:hypothetical protein
VVTPSDDVRTELGDTWKGLVHVGEVYRLLEEGLGVVTIAEQLEGGAAGAWLTPSTAPRMS